MTNGQYNATLTIFFISYSLFEPLTNVLLKKLRPSVFLPIIMLWWYVSSPSPFPHSTKTYQGNLHDYHGTRA